MFYRLKRSLRLWLERSQPKSASPPYTNKLPAYSAHEIGDWTYGKPRIFDAGEGSKLRIGRFCSIGNAVTIMLGLEHRTEWVTTYPFAEVGLCSGPPSSHSRGDVTIGHDVWIGDGAFIRSGVDIGTGAVIGARSVVTRNVAPYAVVVGNPARFLRYRIPEFLIPAVLETEWWNWDLAKIQKEMPLLLSDQIEEFVARNAPRPMAKPA